MTKKILVVDDSATVRKTLSLTLGDAGYAVFEADGGTAALDMVAEENFDLLMTDLNMPEMNGISFITKVRKIPGHRFTPIIILSGEAKEERHRECVAAGASGYLQKPFNRDQVLGILNMVVPY